MSPRMSEINAGESQWLKVHDLEQMAGCDWSRVNVNLVVESTSISEYKPGETAYCLHFHGIAKPLGCNVTNRRMLEQMLGDVDWLEQSIFRGVRLLVYVEQTEKGPGIRIRPAPDTQQDDRAAMQQERAATLAKINASAEQHRASEQTYRNRSRSEGSHDAPPGTYHADDPGPVVSGPEFFDDSQGGF